MFAGLEFATGARPASSCGRRRIDAGPSQFSPALAAPGPHQRCSPRCSPRIPLEGRLERVDGDGALLDGEPPPDRSAKAPHTVRHQFAAMADHHLTEELLAFIEIPRGSRNKYEFDEGIGAVILDRFLSSSMVYPTDYGYLVGHRGRDSEL